jgi:hypothetical protein
LGKPVVPDVYSQKAMSWEVLGTSARRGLAWASASSNSAPTISCRGEAATSESSGRSDASTTTSAARLSRTMAAYSAGDRRVFSGTATAPIFMAPKKLATNGMPSGRSMSTRSSVPTPSARKALPARLTMSATAAYE